MQLNLNLKEDKKNNKERVAKAKKKKAQAKYVPTFSEVWETGYTSHTGTFKKAIFQAKNSKTDLNRLQEVYRAIQSGELGVGVEDMRKFTKAHALRLYKELLEIRKEQIIADMIKNKPDNYILVQDEEMLEQVDTQLTAQAWAEGYIGLDTETTGLDMFGEEDFIVGVSISIPLFDEHYYIPIRHNVKNKQLKASTVFSYLKEHIENRLLGKVLHNAKFDAHMLYKEGIELNGVIMDTQIAMHVLNENEQSYALKNLATKYGKHFGFEDKSATYSDLFGKGGFQDTPLDIGTIYACKDTHLVVAFYKWIMSFFKQQPELWDVYKLENEVLTVVIEMERKGMRIDLDRAEQVRAELTKKVAEAEERVREAFGDINLNSPVQLAELFYDTWGLKDISKNRKTDASTIEALASQREEIKLLLEYRELNKLLTTYIEPIPKMIKADGRLHGQFQQDGTVTGRFSSKEPNLQNIDQLSRRIFIPAEGHILVGIDYSQQEPRLLAHFSQDEELINTYRAGQDLYSKMASIIFKVPVEECGDKSKYRKTTKMLVLAILYGMSDWSLSEILNISKDEAETLRTDFLDGLPSVKRWIEGTYEELAKNGYVRALGGRKRRFPAVTKKLSKYDPTLHHFPAFPKLHAKFEALKREYGDFDSVYKLPIAYKRKKILHAEHKHYESCKRQAVNFRIQSSASYWTKLSLVQAHKLLKSWGYGSILATVHDENIYELPIDISREKVEEIEDAMMNCIELSVPRKVDTEFMERWGEGVDKSEWYS